MKCAAHWRGLFGLSVLFGLAAPAAPAQVALVADVAPGEASSNASNLTVYDDDLYFTAEASGDERGLWRYGTASDAAELVVALGSDETGPTQLTVSEGRLFFTVEELLPTGVYTRIWSFDSETDSAEPVTGML